MITLTRLNGKTIIINALLIETVEETPDTIISLTTGKKYIVKEKGPEVIQRVQSFLSSIGLIRSSVKLNLTEES